jgi:hypothetical protein
MKKINFIYLFCFISFTTFAQERIIGNELENEFFTSTENSLPITYSSLNGLSFDYFFPKSDIDENDDNFYSDFSGLTLNVGPTGNATLERSSRFISLEQASTTSPRLEASDDRSPYVLVENKNWDLGGGIEIYHNYLSDRLSMGGSFSFLKGKNYYSVRKLKYKDEKRSPLKIPYSLKNLENWRIGDQLFYASRGGIVTNIFLGIKPILSFGPEYVHYGSYRIRAQLMAKDKLEIEFTTTKTNSISFELSSTPFGMELLTGNTHLKSLLYEFDLTSDEAISGIEDLFHGRLDLTHKKILSLEGKIKISSDIQQNFSNFSHRLGIPLVYTNGRAQGSIAQDGILEIEAQNERKIFEVYSHSYSKDYFTRGFISDKKLFNQTQTTTILRGINNETSHLGSLYSWSFSKLRMKAKTIKKKLFHLSHFFGKPFLRQISFPEKNLGHLKAEVAIGFSNHDLLFLHNLENLNLMHQMALKALEVDFIQYGHRSFCPLRRKEQCLLRLKNQIKFKVDQLKANIPITTTNYRNNHLNLVCQRLTENIALVISSKYLGQSFFKLRDKINLEVLFEGEKIKKHRFSL